MKTCNCPRCAHKLSDSSDPTGQGLRPAAGDITVCVFCSTVLVFTEDLGVRLMLRPEFEQLVKDDPRVLEHLGRAMIAARLMRIKIGLTNRN
jgi:hypothetical protein